MAVCNHNEVDWEKVQPLTWPENTPASDPKQDCVFPLCSTAHSASSSHVCCRCGGRCTNTCLTDRLRAGKNTARFLPPTESSAWVCPPCCWDVSNGSPLIQGLMGSPNQEIRALANFIQSNLAPPTKKPNNLSLPRSIDIRLVKEWIPYVGSPNCVDALLERVEKRYGPFAETPVEETSGAVHESTVLFKILSSLVSSEGTLAEHQAGAFHTIMIRLEAL